MKIGRQFVVTFLVLGLLLSIACKKNKTPQLAPQTQAPTLAVSVPNQIPEYEPPPEQPAPPQEATVEEPPPKKAPPKHHGTLKKPAQPPVSNQANTTVAVNRPPVGPATEVTTDTAIAADVSSQQLVQQKQTTAQLLDATEKDLKSLSHSLSHDQQAMVTQINSYITQSRKATSDGNFERAYNLAVKAHLLADALVKQ
jgi:hypothetical protein